MSDDHLEVTPFHCLEGRAARAGKVEDQKSCCILYDLRGLMADAGKPTKSI